MGTTTTVKAEAAEDSRMTLSELAEFVEASRSAGVPMTSRLVVQTKGMRGHLRTIEAVPPKP